MTAFDPVSLLENAGLSSDPRERIVQMCQISTEIDRCIAADVVRCRESQSLRVSWDSIGRLLGTGPVVARRIYRDGLRLREDQVPPRAHLEVDC